MAGLLCVALMGDEEVILRCEIHDTDLARRWQACLSHSLSLEDPIYERDRIHGFLGSSWNETRIIKELNSCIDTINAKCGYNIPERAVADSSQEDFNKLHKHFEIMRGLIHRPSIWFEQGDAELRRAMERYNVLIHHWEHMRGGVGSQGAGKITVTFSDRQRHLLHEADWSLFTADVMFGGVYLDYCEVGKHLLDVFQDQDDAVGDDAILPQRYYSSAFVIKFWEEHSSSYWAQFEAWWSDNQQALQALGFTRDDPQLGLGYLPVATLMVDQPRERLLAGLAKCHTVSRVWLE
jgi:hypothetical protein